MSEPATAQPAFEKPPHFELRMSLLVAAIFVPMGIHLPYFPLWLESLGLGATEIAFVLSAPLFLRVFTTPFFTAFADTVNDRAHVLIAAAGVTVFLSLGYLLEPTYFWLLVLSLALHIVWTPLGPLADSLTLSGVRRFGTDYASIRKWGSVAFLAANLAGGALISHFGASAVPFMISACLSASFIAALSAPRLGRPRQASPLSIAELRQGVRTLMTRSFVLIAIGAGVINASHGLFYAFGSIYWKSVGLDGATIGWLWAWAVIIEVPLMMAFSRLFGRFSAPAVLALAGAAAVVRWIAFPLVIPAGGGAAAFFAVQSLHALSTGLVLVGVPKMIADTVGEEKIGSAQGLVFFANGLSMAVVTLLSGPIYDAYGVGGFYIMAAAAAAGVGLIGLAAISPKDADRAAKPETLNR
ncbi:MAG: MFS transporter [Rhizobiaceae bacterium]|nr:MFS transporter [Rhizobiaceae bacterium]